MSGWRNAMLRPEVEQAGCSRGLDRALVEVELASGPPDRS